MNKKKPLPSLDYLNECFELCAGTGVLTWKHRPLNHFASQKGHNVFTASKVGKPAGSVGDGKYSKVMISGQEVTRE